MSKGGGADSGGNQAASAGAAAIQPVPQTQYDTSLGTGATTYVPNPYTAEGKPDWMQGVWDMPNWGKDAVTGADLTQENLGKPTDAPATEAVVPMSTAPVARVEEEEMFIPTGQNSLDLLIQATIANGGMSVAQANEATAPIRKAEESASRYYSAANSNRTWTSD